MFIARYFAQKYPSNAFVCKSTAFYLKSKGFCQLSDKIETNKHVLYDKTQTNMYSYYDKTERNTAKAHASGVGCVSRQPSCFVHVFRVANSRDLQNAAVASSKTFIG